MSRCHHGDARSQHVFARHAQSSRASAAPRDRRHEMSSMNAAEINISRKACRRAVLIECQPLSPLPPRRAARLYACRRLRRHHGGIQQAEGASATEACSTRTLLVAALRRLPRASRALRAARGLSFVYRPSHARTSPASFSISRRRHEKKERLSPVVATATANRRFVRSPSHGMALKRVDKPDRCLCFSWWLASDDYFTMRFHASGLFLFLVVCP